MSASPMARQATECKAIPKRIQFNDLSELPHDYSSTPGGTLFSTTPGGTKIVYEKSFLLSLRNSPVSKTPPKWDIPNELKCNNNNVIVAHVTPPTKKVGAPIKPRGQKLTKKVEDNSELFDLEI